MSNNDTIQLEQNLYERINAIVDNWKAEQHARQVFLYYVWKGNRVEIHDGRSQVEKVMLLDKHETDILNMCSKPVPIKRILEHWEKDLGSIELANIFASLVERGLLFQDQEQVVSLILENPMFQSIEAADESIAFATAGPSSEGKKLLIRHGVVVNTPF